jgi:hypothetical protein
MTMFQLTPSEVRKEVIQDIESGLVPFVQGSPGISKSAMFRSIAKEFNLVFIDIRLSQCAPEDLMGLPMRKDDKASFIPFDMWPLEGQEVPEGKNGWLILFDEFNSASKSVQAAAYRPVLDHEVGQHKLHENAFIACAGNLATDKAIVNSLSTAMQSRVVHYEMIVSHKDFMAHAVKAGFDHRALGFLEFQPGKLHHFSPDHQDRTFPCPRTWEFISKKIKGRELKDISVAGLAGCIGDGTAVELHTFMQEYGNLPSYQSIIDNPGGTIVPRSASTCYALVTMMLDRFSRESFPKAVVFVKRLSPEFQVIYFRGVVSRDPAMRRERDYAANIGHLVKFLQDTSDEDSVAA